jgi:hypothetical protein
MVCEEFLLAARESRSIVGWVEKRNPTPLTITPLMLGLKLFHFMPLGILLQPNRQKLN